jgi:hypothetical protein
MLTVYFDGIILRHLAESLMKRLLPAVALSLAAAWGCSGGAVEIPTVELGGADGARLMNGQAKAPADVYDNAYAQLTRAHYNVRRNLDSRSQNHLAAREAMKQIVGCLEVMRACVPDADRARFNPYLERYAGWQTEVEKGTWGGSFLTDFDRAERELKSRFSPSATEVLAEFPGSAPRKPEPASPAKRPGTAEASKPAPADPEGAPKVSVRVLFKAWSAAHADLVAAYREKAVCKAKYEDVIESLRAMKVQLAGDPAAKLQIYIDYYGGVDEKTRGFTALPEKTSEKDILDELDVAARVIRKEFNPEK